MLPVSAGSVSQVRSVGLALSFIVILYFLVNSFTAGSNGLSQSARYQLQATTNAISHYTPWPHQPPQITKITSLSGEKDNDLYEAAIRSHEEHDRIHGYETRVFREEIVETYYSKPSLLLSVLVTELEKPVGERTEWLIWMSPDIMILNPQIPLEIFLPPDEFKYGHILATRDEDGVNSGVIFVRVHPWSLRTLIDILAVPKTEFGQHEPKAGRKALEKVLRSDRCRDNVFYLPRRWYNAYQISASSSEAQRGDLLVHFHGSDGDKWGAMASVISNTEQLRRDWSLPLEQTSYVKEINEYWGRIREAKELLARAREKSTEPHVDGSYRRLQYATTYEVDDVHAMRSAIGALKEATGIQ